MVRIILNNVSDCTTINRKNAFQKIYSWNKFWTFHQFVPFCPFLIQKNTGCVSICLCVFFILLSTTWCSYPDNHWHDRHLMVHCVRDISWENFRYYCCGRQIILCLDQSLIVCFMCFELSNDLNKTTSLWAWPALFERENNGANEFVVMGNTESVSESFLLYKQIDGINNRGTTQFTTNDTY